MAKSSIIDSPAVKAAVCGLGAYWLAKSVLRHSRKISLQGRVVLITGGSRGLGLAIAREFADAGAHIAICARGEEQLSAAEKNLKDLGAIVGTFTCDLKDEKQIQRMIDDVESQMGPIDVLVNCAGTIIVGPLEAMTVDDFRQAMDVNFWSALHTSLAVTPKMKSRGGGRIVNIGSIGGKMTVPHLAPYCASKFALVGLSGAMRTELIKDGVLVTNVNPGLMRTGSPRNASFKGNHAAEYAWFAISDSLPGISMSAKAAAKKIVMAAIYGDAEVTLGFPAQLATILHGIAPNLQLELASVVNRLLPAGTDQNAKAGSESESWITRSFFKLFGQGAEKDFNQLKSIRAEA